MNTYADYLDEIEARKKQGLHPKPIQSAELTTRTVVDPDDFSAFASVDVNELGLVLNGFTTRERTRASGDLGGLGPVRVDPTVLLVAGPVDSAVLERFDLRFNLSSTSVPEPTALALVGTALLVGFV